MQRAYRRMLECIRAHQPIYAREFPDVSREDLSRTLFCIDMDHPELFWMDAYQSIFTRMRMALSLENAEETALSFDDLSSADLDGDGRVSIGERVLAMSGEVFSLAPWAIWAIDDKLAPSFRSMGMDEARTQECIDGHLAACEEMIPPDADDYQVLKEVVRYIAHNTRYNLRKARKSQDICSVFAKGESVCKGYSEALQYLLLSFGMPCFTVSGVARLRESSIRVAHSWNYVMVDGKWCIVDATWADTDWDNHESTSDLPQWLRSEYVAYEYLCIDGRDRVAADIVPYPKRSRASDYFLREHCQVDELRLANVAPALFQLFSGKKKYVALRCKGSVYRLIHYLDRVSRSAAYIYVGVGGDASRLQGLSDSECFELAQSRAKLVSGRAHHYGELVYFPTDTSKGILVVWLKSESAPEKEVEEQ